MYFGSPLPCHLDRSEAEWRDLRLPSKAQAMTERDHHYYVYIVASRTHVLYVGVTNNIRRRVEQHRTGDTAGFTATYQCHRLVWFESYKYVYNALNREKQVKRWGRAKKIWLIERTNPTWADLSEDWRNETADLSTPLRSVEKHTASA